ncbi:MAG: hypothetical protein HXY40_12865 [Chloroflexi bacterium]|nr:hypothetical protein [Chloroflexota bacterium]
MLKRILALLAALLVALLAACDNLNAPAQLPTLAVFPTATLTPVPSAAPVVVTQVVGIPTPTPPPTDVGVLIGTLVEGQVQGGLFDDGRIQVYTFEARAGQMVSISMARVSGTLDPYLLLISPSGEPLAVDDNNGVDGGALLRNIPLPVSGVYRVQASGKGFTGGYSIQLLFNPQPVTPVFSTPAPAAPQVEVLTPTLATAVSGRNRLEDHVPLLGSISRAGDIDIFSFFAAAGERISVGVSPAGDGALRPNIDIIGPDGEVIASANADNSAAGDDALVANVPIRSTAVYSVYITGLENTMGDYVVSYGRGVSREDVQQGRTIADQAFVGTIPRRGLRHVWSLYLNAGDIIAVAVTPDDESFDPVLEFALANDDTPDDTTDNVIARDDNSGGARAALIAQVSAPASGLYHIRITAAGAASVGAYTMIWRYINAAPTATPLPGVVAIFSIAETVPPNTYLFYPFQGQAGVEMQIRVVGQAGSGLDPVVAVLDPAGQVIAEADDSDGTLNPRLTLTLPENGTFTVRVAGYSGSSGGFTLTVERLFPAS